MAGIALQGLWTRNQGGERLDTWAHIIHLLGYWSPRRLGKLNSGTDTACGVHHQRGWTSPDATQVHRHALNQVGYWARDEWTRPTSWSSRYLQSIFGTSTGPSGFQAAHEDEKLNCTSRILETGAPAITNTASSGFQALHS